MLSCPNSYSLCTYFMYSIDVEGSTFDVVPAYYSNTITQCGYTESAEYYGNNYSTNNLDHFLFYNLYILNKFQFC